MNVLVFNCGSSSLRFKVYEVTDDGSTRVVGSGKARNVATPTRAAAAIDWTIEGTAGTRSAHLPTHQLVACDVLAILREAGVRIDAVGHRFVHGATLFDRTARIDDAAMAGLRACVAFAPVHNPCSLAVIEACGEALHGIPQFAVFDTSFHCGMPDVARHYAIPHDLADRHGFHKYGFHGLSYQYVSVKTAELMGLPLEELRLIVCHLGTGGASVAAIRGGRSVETSMGYSPVAGLVMGTRSGDLDPEIVLELVRHGIPPDEVGRMINEESGLVGLSGYSSNLLEVIEAAEDGNTGCRLAFDVYAHRLEAYLGSYFWLLGGADAIVFTDDVGLRAWQLRERVCGGAEQFGVVLDPARNRSAGVDAPALVSAPASRTQIWLVPTDEEAVILAEVLEQLREPAPAG